MIRTLASQPRFTWGMVLILGWCAQGCGGITPLWKGDCQELAKSKTLYYQQPCEYAISSQDLSEPGPYALELTLTYYIQIGRSELPLYLNIEDAKHDIQEFYFTIPLKKDGRDLGHLAQNEIDLTITHLAIPRLELPEESYTLRVFYDGERLMEEEAKGIIALEARLFQAAEYISN
ncbi:MAG: hypothetical protein NWR72_06085 [Bacteroidia bacterium]|nr:hypothetical protein [Bacteroidia bacterium]